MSRIPVAAPKDAEGKDPARQFAGRPSVASGIFPPMRRSRLVATPVDDRSPALRSALAAALTAEGLPATDLAWPGRVFHAYTTDRAKLAGFAGLQLCGEHALIRSVVVLPACRGRGLVLQIVPHILACAQAAGARYAWLLTEDARPLFERLGFSVVAGANVPAVIAALSEFQALSKRHSTPMTAVLV